MLLKDNLKLFAKMFFGVASDQERKKVFYSKESSDMMDKDWNDTAFHIGRSVEEKNKSLQKIQGAMFSRNKPRKTSSNFIIFLRKYAAVLILGLCLGTIGTYIILNKNSFDKISYVHKINPKGNRTSFLLPDGSKVWLNAESKIIYPQKFKNSKREVYLKGEAYFEVKKDVYKPFIVITDDIEIDVLGTRFNVSAYPDDETVETTLVEGKIGISDFSKEPTQKNRYILKKNFKASFNKKDQEFSFNKVDVKPFTSWTKGKLIFDNVSFSEIRKKLERNYDVQFVTGAEILEEYNYTITITDESIEEIMQLIQKTSPIDFQIENKRIYIFRNK